MLIDYRSPTKDDLCQRLTVLRYGFIECLTKAKAYQTVVEVGVKNVDTGEVYAPAGDPGDAVYTTFADEDQPKITGPATVFTSADNIYYFKTQGFGGLNCRAFYLGVESDSCADAYYEEEYGAFWNAGVPRTAHNEALVVILMD